MKITANDLILLFYLMLTTFCSLTLEDERRLSSANEFPQSLKETVNPKKSKSQTRITRQNYKKSSQPPGLFIAISSLLGGTVADTFTAYRNISRLVQGAFAPPRSTTSNQTAPTNGTRFTLRQALALLGRNYRGLRRLFDSEFTKALNESEKTVMDFHRELKSSAKMYLEYNTNNTIR